MQYEENIKDLKKQLGAEKKKSDSLLNQASNLKVIHISIPLAHS